MPIFTLALRVAAPAKGEALHITNQKPTIVETVNKKVEPSVQVASAVVAPSEQPKSEPQPIAVQVPSGKEELMTAAGIPSSDWGAVDYIVSNESGWNPLIWNKGGSGAYGLCQSLPASKMASEGEDYMTNPVTQLRWCNNYAIARYGGWWLAQTFWANNRLW